MRNPTGEVDSEERAVYDVSLQHESVLVLISFDLLLVPIVEKNIRTRVFSVAASTLWNSVVFVVNRRLNTLGT